MDLVFLLVDMVLHFDKYLPGIIASYGFWTYLILFLIIFCETGLVVTPYLPGDSLLFVAGALAGAGLLNIETLILSLVLAAVLGDSLNYWIGHTTGMKILDLKYSFVKKEHLDKTVYQDLCAVPCRRGKDELPLVHLIQPHGWRHVDLCVHLNRVFLRQPPRGEGKFQPARVCDHWHFAAGGSFCYHSGHPVREGWRVPRAGESGRVSVQFFFIFEIFFPEFSGYGDFRATAE
jgi:hypothetical protein